MPAVEGVSSNDVLPGDASEQQFRNMRCASRSVYYRAQWTLPLLPGKRTKVGTPGSPHVSCGIPVGPRGPLRILLLALLALLASAAPAVDRGGRPVTKGLRPTASDALHDLRGAVGLSVGVVCECDVDGSGNQRWADALKLLQASRPLRCAIVKAR